MAGGQAYAGDPHVRCHAAYSGGQRVQHRAVVQRGHAGMVSGGAVPPPRILNGILVPHRIIKAGVYPQNACGNTPAIFLKKRLIATNRCNGFNGAAHPLCGNKPWNPLWIPRLVNAKSGCGCRNRRYFRLFRYTLDRGIIEVNIGVEVRLDKPKTRISYADTRVFVGGVREI